MIFIKDFILLLQDIPIVLQYFLPGYWSIRLLSFFTSRTIDRKERLLLSCLLSYLSISIISLFYKIDNVLMLSGISFILLTALTIIASMMYSTKWFKKILVKFFYKTPYNDIWHDILDLHNGSNVKVYFKNSQIGIIGHHKVHEENGDNSWFAISAPIKFDIETNEVVEDANQDNEDFVVTFKLNEVEHMEIF